MRQPALQSCEAPDHAQPGTHAPRDACGLGGRDLAASNGRQNGGQHRPEILDRAQRRQIDPETPGRLDGSERRRQQLRGQRPQQMRPAVDQIRQRLRAQRPCDEIGHAPLRIGDAARPAPRVAGASLGEAPARATRARHEGIRAK
jgi:hypothetical protein